MLRYRFSTPLFTLIFAAASLAGSVHAQPLRISDQGPALSEDFAAMEPAVAYNPDLDQYLVAWSGNDHRHGLDPAEYEIFIQLVDAKTGQRLLAEDVLVSVAGGVGDPRWNVEQWVSAAYNSTERQYLVVWSADDDFGQADGEYEIFAQLIDAETGLVLLPYDQRISDLGPANDETYDAVDPVAIYNPVQNQYLVAWSGRDTGQERFGDYEIFVQRLDGKMALELPPNDQRISAIGGAGLGREPYHVRSPALAHDPEHDIYLVAWQIEEISTLDDREMAIVAQRLDGETGAEIAPHSVRIGATSSGNVNYLNLGATYNPKADEFLVVWPGQFAVPFGKDGEYREDVEIFAQAIDAVTGAEVGVDDLQVSTMGGLGDPNSQANDPGVVYDESRDQYLVVWSGNDPLLTGGKREFELFARWLPTPRAVSKQFRLTSVGPPGHTEYFAADPELALGSDGVPFVVWWGNDDDPTLSLFEYEVFGMFVGRSGL